MAARPWRAARDDAVATSERRSVRPPSRRRPFDDVVAAREIAEDRVVAVSGEANDYRSDRLGEASCCCSTPLASGTDLGRHSQDGIPRSRHDGSEGQPAGQADQLAELGSKQRLRSDDGAQLVRHLITISAAAPPRRRSCTASPSATAHVAQVSVAAAVQPKESRRGEGPHSTRSY